jgi:HD domain
MTTQRRLASRLDKSRRRNSYRSLSTVAGVRLVDPKIARDATQLGHEAYPPYLFNHAVRTFLFASLIGKKLRQRFDEEVLYLACILHDLGLTDRFEGELPFEISRSRSSKNIPRTADIRERLARYCLGWNRHARFCYRTLQAGRDQIGGGAGTDIVGPDYSQISKTDVDEILGAFPRLELKNSFLKTCAGVVRRHPGGATRSFMRDIGERYVPEFNPQNFCDLVIHAPFPE